MQTSVRFNETRGLGCHQWVAPVLLPCALPEDGRLDVRLTGAVQESVLSNQPETRASGRRGNGLRGTGNTGCGHPPDRLTEGGAPQAHLSGGGLRGSRAGRLWMATQRRFRRDALGLSSPRAVVRGSNHSEALRWNNALGRGRRS